MACSWVMVWIPSKKFEQYVASRGDTIDMGPRLRLFSDESMSTVDEEDELDKDFSEPLNEIFRNSKVNEGISSKSNLVVNVSECSNMQTNLDAENYDTKEVLNDKTQVEVNAKRRCSRNQSEHTSDNSRQVPLVEKPTYEEALVNVLSSLNITQVVNQKSKNNRYNLVTFCIDNGLLEGAMISLQKHGIGYNGSTSISVLPASVHLSTPILQIEDG